ncbi:MAG: alkaline phosphatase [Planctomycetes bacterium]|nr:alkaline phosphatase [Planctomycetota bacterium]MBU1518881.1 alkaline phosphatase [Planctomycetota bacterium]MBU2457129.1 alkaline phosphatase [Planctomycetota bacterium]
MKIITFGLILSFVVTAGTAFAETGAKNVILFIGDGMGPEQVKAAGMYANGAPNSLCFELFPYKSTMTTYSADNAVTDSAAAGTAIATGYKVNNSVVSKAIPGDSGELLTRLEYAKLQGKKTGLVTTTYMSHATPACFGAHENSRDNYTAIVIDYLNQTKPNILFGGGANGITSSAAIAAGYTVVTDRASLNSLDTDTADFISGQFGSTHLPYEYDGLGTLPHLSEMTTVALNILDNEPNGFFLMVEGGKIDHAGHNKDLERNVFETIEFANSVQVAIDWSDGGDDTLIIVTADHETGGLTVIQNNGQGQFPTVTWTTTNHTDADVPVYGWGFNAYLAENVSDNTDIFAATTIGYPDYNSDNDSDFEDFAFFAAKWRFENCQPPDYCDGTDLDISGYINSEDLALLINNWLTTTD